MILGIDTGLATFGWALLDEHERSFEDLGVVIQPKLAEGALRDRVRRCRELASAVAKRAAGCNLVVVEQLSLGVPGALAKLSIGMSWGVVAGVIAALSPRPRLLTISPQRWQREVLPNAGKRVDYDELARVAAKYILAKHPKAARALESIAPSHRSHAIDAAMIALVGAKRPERCEVV